MRLSAWHKTYYVWLKFLSLKEFSYTSQSNETGNNTWILILTYGVGAKNNRLINATDLNIWNAVYLPQDRQRFICSFFCEQLCYYETIFKRYLKKYLIASSSFENVDNTNDADDVDAQTS